MLPAVEVSHPAGPDEQEAERIADALSGAHPGYDEARMRSTRTDVGTLRRAAASAGTESGAAAEAGPAGGQALDAGVREWFEPRLGASLGGVRIHNDGSAAEAARHLHARAFTFGGHIGFAAGEYSPETAGGHRLLAHELAHVLQERQGAVPAIRRVAGAAQPSDLISRYTSWWGNLDEEALGRRLFELAWMSPDHYAFVIDVIDALPSGDRDDVSLFFALSAREENLDEFAQTEDGRRMMRRMESELLSGFSRFQEQQQALRLRQAAARQTSTEAGLAQGRKLLETAYQAPLSPAAATRPEPSLTPQQALERLRLVETVLDQIQRAYPKDAAVLNQVASARTNVGTTRDALSSVDSAMITRRIVAGQAAAERIASLLPQLDQQIERHRASPGASGPALASLAEAVRGYYLTALGLVGADGVGDAFNHAEQAAARLPRAMTEVELAAFEGRAPTYELLEPSRKEIAQWVGQIRTDLSAFETDVQALAAARAAGAADVADREQQLTGRAEMLQLSLEALQHWEQALRGWEYLAGGGSLIPQGYRSISRIIVRCQAMHVAAGAGDLKTLRDRVEAHRNDPDVAEFYRGLPIVVAGSQMLTGLGITLVAAMASGGIGGLARLAIGTRVSAGLAFAGTAAIETLTFTTVTHVLGAVVPGAPSSGDFLVDLIWNFGLFAALHGVSLGVRAGLAARGLEILEKPVGLVTSATLLQGYGILRFTIEQRRLPTGAELDRMTADNLVMLLGITVTTASLQRAIEARTRLVALRTFQRQYGWRFQEFEAGRQRLIDELRTIITSGQAADPARVDALRRRAQTLDALFRELVEEVRGDRTISLERARAELQKLGLDLESASAGLLAASLGLPEQVGLRPGGGLEQYTYGFGRTQEVKAGLQALGATQVTETVDPVTGLRAITAELSNRPPIYLVERAPALLPQLSTATEQQIAALIADSNPAFPLTRINAIRALSDFPGFTPQVAGPGGAGADVVFRRGHVAFRREVKAIAGGAQGSFNREVGHAAEQIGYDGDILVQMPAGSDGLRSVRRFRGSRPTPADLGIYRSVRITIVDPAGTLLWEGNLVE
jgi:hypothetical protein